MTIFIGVLLLVVIVVVGGMFQMLPSAGDKALARQRDHATACGLRALLRAAPDWLGLPPGQGLVGQYHWIQASRQDAQGRWCWRADLDRWQREDAQAAAAAPWPTPAPAGWLGVDVSAHEVVVYWQEDGRTSSVDQMLTLLRQVAA